jgi:uncharacterized protein
VEFELLLMILAAFGAATLQSATGIGFGIVAGPILLMQLNSGAAIQISILLNLLISLVLAPSIKVSVDKKLLSKFLLGSIVGLPVGFYVFLMVDTNMLKIMAGVAILVTMFFVLRNNTAARRENRNPESARGALPMGVISGLMGGSLAMPGPIPAAWMTASGYDKATVRATILMLFIISYSAALILQLSLAEITTQTWWTSLKLALPTVAGIYFGRLLAERITEQVFIWLIIGILASTAALLFSTLQY